jgi:uncharacterized protein (DUF3084 family)
MVLSAVTAYFADIWGRRLGKKRKTIGRLRPKYTAIVIITSAGALIALLSFVVLLTADAGIRRALLHWDQTVAEKRALQAELVRQKSALDAEIASEKSEVERTRLQVKTAKAEVATAMKDLAAARLAYKGSKAALANSQNELSKASAALGMASAQLNQTHSMLQQSNVSLATKKHDIAEAQRILNEQTRYAKQEFDRANAIIAKSLYGEVAARGNEELARAVVPRGVSLNVARETLRKLLNEAGRLVQQRSHGVSYEGKPFVAVRDRMALQATNGKLKQVRLSGLKSTDVAAERLADPRNPPGGVVVRVIAQSNTVAGETVKVDFQLVENHLLFEKGQEITSFILKSSQGKQAVSAAITGALKDVAVVAAKAEIIPTADNSIGSPPLYQLMDVYSEVTRAFREGQDTVRVRVLAAQDTWTSDDLKLRFEVKRYTEGG